MSSSPVKSPLPATPPAARPASMQDVARKIRGRTADLLAIAIIVGATLSFGSQIISWWRSGPPADAAGNPVLTPPGWDLDGQPVDLGFGDLPVTLTRQQIAGDHPAAVEALFEACREITMAATAPLGETPDAEQRLIERVASLTPRSELPGAWQVYVVDDAFPFVVGLKTLTVNSGTAKPPTTAPAAPTAEHSAPADSEQIPRRLVCYGLAMPAGEQAWTLFIARNSTHPTVTGATGFEIALPPGATQTLSLRDRRGSLLVGFSGLGSPADWIAFFNEWTETRGWQRSSDWSQGHESWAARFTGADRHWIDIRLARDGRGALSGVLQVVPESPE